MLVETYLLKVYWLLVAFYPVVTPARETPIFMQTGTPRIEKCSLSKRELEDVFLYASARLEQLKGKENVSSFIDRICHPFIKNAMKIDYSTENPTTHYFSFDSIEKNIMDVKKVGQRVSLWAQLGKLAMSYNESNKARYYANKANDLVPTIVSHSNISYSGLFILGKLYAHLGDPDAACSVADNLEDEEKEALITEIEKILENKHGARMGSGLVLCNE